MPEVQILDGRSGSVEVRLDGHILTMSWQGLRFEEDDFEMAKLDLRQNVLSIFPRKSSSTGLVPQFERVEELRVHLAGGPDVDAGDLEGSSFNLQDLLLDWVVTEGETGEIELTGLPDGFGKVFAYGLGLRRPYRGLVGSIETMTTCTVVEFAPTVDEGPDGNAFGVLLQTFARYRSAVDRNRDRATTVARRVNATESHNAIASIIGSDLAVPPLGRLPLIQAMTREVAADVVFDAEDREILVRETTRHSHAIATEAPAQFGKLRHDLDLVSLEVLISQFESSLSGRHAGDEPHWQRFFQNNTFALQQLFAAPIVLYRGQLTVRGSNAFGSGERIADFMLVNSLTRSAHVVEIKTPAARMMRAAPYRGSGGSEVFVPHTDLLGAVTQLQAQMESTRLHLPSLLRDTPGATDLDITSVRGAVIAGTVESLSYEQRTSFMRYRDGLTHIEVLAFDEVRDRLKGLHEVLSRSRAEDQTG